MAETVAMRQTGSPIGPRAQQTREIFLDRLEHELGRTPWSSVRVIDVARDSGWSPASFYQYFRNLEAAFDALCARIQGQGRQLPTHIGLIRALLDYERDEL